MANKCDTLPIHPGESFLEKLLTLTGIRQYCLSEGISAPQRPVSEIVQGRHAITADSALRLGRYFAMEPQYWLNLRTQYDLQ